MPVQIVQPILLISLCSEIDKVVLMFKAIAALDSVGFYASAKELQIIPGFWYDYQRFKEVAFPPLLHRSACRLKS